MERVGTKDCLTTGGNYIDNDFKCLRCGFYDTDFEMCTVPSTDKWYACPLETVTKEDFEEELKHAPAYVNTTGKGAT